MGEDYNKLVPTLMTPIPRQADIFELFVPFFTSSRRRWQEPGRLQVAAEIHRFGDQVAGFFKLCGGRILTA